MVFLKTKFSNLFLISPPQVEDHQHLTSSIQLLDRFRSVVIVCHSLSHITSTSIYAMNSFVGKTKKDVLWLLSLVALLNLDLKTFLSLGNLTPDLH